MYKGNNGDENPVITEESYKEVVFIYQCGLSQGISNHFNHHSFVDYFFFNSLLANRDEWQVCCTRWYIWIFFRVSFQEDFKLENLVSGTYSCILQSHHNMLKFENFSSRDYETWRHYLDKIKPLCILLLSLLSQSLLVSFLRIRGAYHAPGASVTQEKSIVLSKH